MVEYTFVNKEGKSELNQLGIQSDKHIHGLKKIVKIIEKNGAIAAIQLSHGGAKSNRQLTGGKLVGPSAIAVPIKSNDLEKPESANLDDIIEIKSSFLAAARRAKIAGFKFIELHSAHGYGLNQWLSPLTNQRSDCYGGSLKNRSRLLNEIVKEIKDLFPDLLISVRIPGQDHLEGGLRLHDAIQIAKELEKSGVNIINVSSGMGGWRRPRKRNGEGYLVDDAKLIQKHLNIPVIGVGGIKTAEYINTSLSQNRFSLAAVGRSILEDIDWGKSVGLKA